MTFMTSTYMSITRREAIHRLGELALVGGVTGAGCLGSDGEAEAEQEQSDQEYATDGRVRIKINYVGSWSGHVETDGGGQSIEGHGTGTVTITGYPSVVSITVQKREERYGASTLSVELWIGGEKVREAQTSAEYGVVNLSHRPQWEHT